jgi:hypothetical protein
MNSLFKRFCVDFYDTNFMSVYVYLGLIYEPRKQEFRKGLFVFLKILIFSVRKPDKIQLCVYTQSAVCVYSCIVQL